MGKGVKLINPGKSVSKEVAKFLIDNNMENDSSSNPKLKFYVTDLTDQFIKTAKLFLGKNNITKIVKTDIP